jgi:uncharacterized membrane protein YraQ (UPF0718 family)
MIADWRSGLVLAAVIAWRRMIQLGPYVVLGTLLAALLGQADLPRRWGRSMAHVGPGAVLGAACLGGASPLCTYGTVPVCVELVRAGASPSLALTFLSSSSLLNPQLFVVMAGGLGLHLALVHACGVLLLSLPVGILAGRLAPKSFLNREVLVSAQPETPSRPHSALRPAPRISDTSRGLSHHLIRLTETVGLHFVVGVSLSAIVQTFVPADWISSLLGASHWYGVLLAGVLGVPFYACGGAAVPVVAGLLTQGMSPGAALAFFLAGPATRLTALAALGTLLNRRALIAYVAYVVVGAALAGTALNLVLGAG